MCATSVPCPLAVLALGCELEGTRSWRMCPDGTSEPPHRWQNAVAWRLSGLMSVALAAACSPTGAGGGASDSPLTVQPPVTPAPTAAMPVVPGNEPAPSAPSGDPSAAGQFIDPDEMPIVPSAPIRRRGLKE